MTASLTIILHDPTGGIDLGAVAERFDVHTFHRPDDILAAANHLNPDAIVLALSPEGVRATERVTSRRPGLPVLLLDHDGASAERVVEAMRAGGRDVVRAGVEGWQNTLSRRLEAGFAWRQALDRGQEVQMAALRAIAERSQGDQVNLDIEIHTLTEQLEAERAVLEQTQSRLEIQRGLAMSAVRAKAAFLSNISHEFNTPLTAIQGYAELVREETEGDTEDLDRIIQTARHLTGLVKSVLNLARLESGDIHPVFESVGVAELLGGVMSKYAQRAREHRVELSVEPSSVDSVVTDPLRLQEALSHILDNAVKYCPGGKVVVQVSLENEEVHFAVTDDGVGMDERALQLVFSAFSHADTGETRRHGGVGLGLAIAQQTARMLGGRLDAQSKVGEGSRFAIVIPHAVAGAVSSNLERELTVMIVDDDPVLRKVLERMLVADGHAALTTGDPSEAVELARTHQPSLIALDVMLPGIDGWTLLRELASDNEVRHIPIVIISATDQSERALEEGARAFLDKPIDREALRGVIRAHAPQPHRVLVLADEIPGYLKPLEDSRFTFRPCRVQELEDSLPSRSATVLFPIGGDASESVRALRILKKRNDIFRIAVGDVGEEERTFLAGRFDGVVNQAEVGAKLRELADRS